MEQKAQSQILVDIVTTRMPYGKFKGWFISDLPEPYLSWYHSKGFPKGKMGQLLSTIYEIKLNGLEYLLKPIKDQVNRGGR